LALLLQEESVISVRQIGRTFVKSTQFTNPETVEVLKSGIRGDRDFFLLESSGAPISSNEHGTFFPLLFDYEFSLDTLKLYLPDGRIAEGPAAGDGTSFSFDYYGMRNILVTPLDGPWQDVLSSFAERPIRLVRCVTTGTGIDILPITIVSTASIRRLEREIGGTVDTRRFRASFILNNEVEHEEDSWLNRTIRVGKALLKVRTPVPRCVIPGFNPQEGARDLNILRTLTQYREKITHPDGLLPGHTAPGFAVYAQVIEPGIVHVGDTVEVLMC
jgi:uncharacterized protein YcbX